MEESEFWTKLERRICSELAAMSDPTWRSWWCDGFRPWIVDHKKREVTGRVWMVHGMNQQDWGFRLSLRKLSTGTEQVDWAALLPAENETCWLKMDLNKEHLTIEPELARPDPRT